MSTSSSGSPTDVRDRGRAFVHVLACVLTRLVAANDALPDQGVVTKFHALRPPSISIRDYLERVNKYANCSPECFVLALVYIDRLIQRNALLLSSLNVHRVIITATMLAAKFFDDQYFNNAYYAKVGGVPTPEVNSLELEFLFSINFSLHVPTAVYEKYVAELSNHMAASSAEAAALAEGNPASATHTPAAACDCAKAPRIAYTAEELRYTGMRAQEGSPSLAAAAATAEGAGATTPLARGAVDISYGGGAGSAALAVPAAAAAAASAAVSSTTSGSAAMAVEGEG